MSSVLCFVFCVLLSLNGMSKTNHLGILDTSIEIPAETRPALQAASVAIHYLNYHHGSPSKLYQLHKVKKTHHEVIFNLGNKYHLEFEVKNENSSNVTEFCTANVSFYKEKNPDITLQCNLRDLEIDSKKDEVFYHNLRKRKDPVIGYNIPDDFGFIDPEMMPVWRMSRVSASYIMWQKSTEIKRYNMLQIRKINQWLRTEKFLQFTFTVLLHEIPTQEIITCTMWVMWKPKHSPTVKYTCLPPPSESSSEASEFGSPEVAGSQRPEVAGSQRPEVAGSQRPEVAGSHRPEVAGSHRPEVAGSHRPEVAGSHRPEVAGSHRPEVAGSHRPEVAGSHRPEGPGSHRPEGPGSHRPEGPGSHRPEGPGSHRPEGPGSQRPEGPGSQRPEGPGSQRPEGPGSQRR